MQLVSFGGTQLFRPGAYSVVNLKNNTPVSVGSFKVLAVVGSGAAGKPASPIYANDPGVANNIVGGSDAVLAAQIMWEHGADLICFSLTDKATQATYAIADTTPTTPKTLVTLKGLRWNAADNSLKITVAAAVNGTQLVTITDTSVTPNVVESYSVANSADGWIGFVTRITANSSLVEAVLGENGTADPEATNVAATVAAVSFAGGSRTAADSSSISAAIDALQSEDIQAIVPTLTDSTSQTAVLTHVTSMSNVQNRRERRAFFGQPVGTTDSEYVTAMAAFKSSRATLVGPGHYKAVNGAKVLLSSAFTAAAVAGRWAGKQNITDPVTGDFINALGLEFTWLGTDIKPLVEAQVTVIESVPKQGYQVVHALTGDPELYELSVADTVDVTTRSMREDLQAKFMGPGYQNVVSDMLQFTTAKLESYKKNGYITDGTDAFGQPLPAYRNVTVTKNGKAYAVSYEIKPSEPVNYITITAIVNLTQ